MVNNRKDSCSGEMVENCGGVVCACGGEVVKMCILCAGGDTGTLHGTGTLEHWNTETTKTRLCREGVWWLWTLYGRRMVVVDSVGKTYGGCGLCRENIWWLWTL